MSDLTDELAAAHAQQATARSYAAGLGPAGAQRITALSAAHPNLGAATLPLAAAGVSPDSSVAQKAAEAKAKRDSGTVRHGDQKTGGWLSRTFGSVADAALGAAGQIIPGGSAIASLSKDHLTDVAKPIVRYGTAGAAFPYEAVQAAVRMTAAEIGLADGKGYVIGDPTAGLRSTTVGAGIAEAADNGDLGQSLADVFGAGTVDEKYAGNGWFINPKTSATGRRQATEARAQATIDGHAFTLGRGLAHATPYEPGTRGYNIVSGLTDLASALALDPLTYVGGKAAEGNRVRNVLDRGDATVVELATKERRSGAITPTIRTGADGESQRVFAAESTGLVDGVRKTVLPEVAAQWLTGPKGNKVIEHLATEGDFERLRRATGKKLPAKVLVDLVDAQDSVQVRNVLADAIQQGAVREKLVFKPERFERPRLAGMMPGDRIDLDDLDDAVEQLDRFQRNVRMDPADISANNEALARAGSKGERFQMVEHVMTTVEKGLVHSGVSKVDAGQVTRMFREARDDMRRYFVDEIGDNAAIPGAQIGRDGRPLPSPHLLDELIDRYLPLPNARVLKRATRQYEAIKKIESSVPYKASRASADFLTSTLFKPFALALRPAWTVRVVGEEQVRMAAAGKDSLFKHPLSYISWIAGESDGKLNALMGGGRGGMDALGQKWADEAALPDSVTEWAQSLNRGSAGWRDRARILTKHYGVFGRTDPEYAEGWHGELIQLAADPVAREVLRNGAVVAKNKFWLGNLQGVRQELHDGMPRLNLNVREHADAYVDSVIDRINVKTGGHSDLIDAVRTGRLKGDVLTDGFNGNPKVRQALADLAEQGHGPAKVKGQLSVKVGEGGNELADAARYYDQAVEWLFHRLGSVPTNKLSRSPMFRQSYWQRLEETLPLLTKSERVRALRSAKEAGLNRGTLARMRKTVDRQTVGGDLLLADADHVAKAHALKATRDLLYSLHEKSQAADALRVLFPFGEAWREVLTRWARLGVDPRTMNPLVPHRATQGIVAAQDAGIFYTDPTTGQEMFAIPGSEWLTEKFTGVPMKLEAPVGGLNMFGQVIPGVGPVVAFLASKIIPDSPEYDGLRQMMLPFGDPDYTGGTVESLEPAWLKKMSATFGLGGAQEKRTLASMSVDVAAYLYSTGDYDLSKPADKERLLDDAKDRAKRLYQIRALAQSTAPSSPRGVFAAKDSDGRLHALFALKEDYRKMLDQDPKTATSRFMDKYGEFAFLVTISKTKDEGANPVTDTADLLARSHPDQAKRFPNVIGLFAEHSDEYSFTEYDRQIASGTRKVQSLDDIVKLGNVRVANAIYAQAKEASSDPAYRREVQDRLKAAYPGYNGKPDNLGRTDTLVQELIRASSDPVLKKTDAGKGLAQYLALRQQAQDAARAAGFAGFQQSAATAPLRAWLYDAGRGIAKEHGDFGEMFERVFQRELPDQGDN